MRWFFGVLLVVLGLGLIVFLLWGPRPNSEMPPSKPLEVVGGFPRTVKDSSGHTQSIPSRPLRIVSTAPSNTEILFAVGAGTQVVGVTTYCNFPEEAAQRDKIGGFALKSISMERIVGLRPDLVLTTGRMQQPLTESLRQLGLTVLSYDAQTLEDVLANIRSIGLATDRADESSLLAKSLEERLERVRDRFSRLAVSDRPQALLLLSEDPLMIAGPNTFAGQMLELAGGRNLFPDVQQQFPRVSEEEVVKRNPGVILLWERGDFAVRKERLTKRPAWSQLDALRNGQVLAIGDDLLYRAGPRLFDGLERLAELLHPSAKEEKE